MAGFDWSPGGCCCKFPYEAWAELVSATDRFAIHHITRGVGEPANSDAEFNITDDYNGDYATAMEVGGFVYLAERNSGDTATSIAKYNSLSGALVWEHSNTMSFEPGGYRVAGSRVGARRMSVNSSQAFFWDGNASTYNSALFESTGVTTYTADPNITTSPYDDTSAAWVPRGIASHDWPMVAGARGYITNYSIDYIGTTGPVFGSYTHNYEIDYDAVFEIGIGEYDPSTGAMGSVAVVDSQTVSYTNVAKSIVSGSPTPPATPTASSWGLANSNALKEFNFQPTSTTPYQTIQVFHSLNAGADYVIAYSVRKEDPAGSASYDYIQKIIINGNTVKSWTDASAYQASISSGALVHDTPIHSQAIVTYEDPPASAATIEGYDLDGTLNWSEVMYDFATVYSVNDTWALVNTPVNVSETLPDGRTWSDVSISGSHINWWMVRLDNGEWEPCRTQSSDTSWANPTAITNAQVGDAINIDLVKSASHPYGPPEVTYGTTPP